MIVHFENRLDRCLIPVADFTPIGGNWEKQENEQRVWFLREPRLVGQLAEQKTDLHIGPGGKNDDEREHVAPLQLLGSIIL